MQHLVREVAVGLAKEFGVQRLDNGVLVALSERRVFVLFVQHLGTRLLHVHNVALSERVGCPPPFTQPPGHAMISIK